MQSDEKGFGAQRKASVLAYGSKWELLPEHDTNTLSKHYKYIFCSAAGTAVMEDSAGTALTLTLAANEILPVLPAKLLVASTGVFYGVIE